MSYDVELDDDDDRSDDYDDTTAVVLDCVGSQV